VTPAGTAVRGLADGSSNGTGGEFVRGATSFHDWVAADGSDRFPAAPGRYHLLRIVPRGPVIDFTEPHGRG